MTPEVIVLTEVIKEPTIITRILDEPIAIIVIVFIIFRKPVELLFNWVVSKFKKNKTKSTEEMLCEVDNKLDSIQSQIDVLSESMAYHAKLSIKQSQGIFENTVFIEKLDPYRKLKAFRRLLGLKGNGGGKKAGFEAALENPKVWMQVLELKMVLQIVDYDYYRNSIKEINAKIFDYGLTIEPDDENAEFVNHSIAGDNHE